MDRSKIPTSYFVTSPNMKQIPNISKDTKDMYIRQNGRFWTHDLALFPQWFFLGTKHLPFITRRPSIEVLPTHPLRFVWYDLEAMDYVPEPGSVADLFRVRTAISDEFYKLRKELDQKIEALIASQPYLTPADLRDMRFAQHGMLMSGTLLSFAAQSRLMTLLNVTTFQRFYLETLAFYDSFTKWEERLLTPRETPHPVDLSVMGLVTRQQDIAQKYYHLGVPVWLVRQASAMMADMKVWSTVWPTTDYPGMVEAKYPNTVMFFQSAPSPLRNRVSVSLGVANVSFGPASREYHPGDPEHVWN